jgi:hypothetical protein
MSFRVEPTGATESPPCACCGKPTRVVWGHVYEDDAVLAAYYVQWTPGDVKKHGASFDFVLGDFGEGTGPEGRSVASIAFRIGATGPQFMVTEASGRPLATSGLASKTLGRKDVIGTPIATTVFDMVDVIWVDDPRVSELHGDDD